MLGTKKLRLSEEFWSRKDIVRVLIFPTSMENEKVFFLKIGYFREIEIKITVFAT